MRFGRATCVGLMGTLCTLVPLCAQGQNNEQASGPDFTTRARSVVVDVVVTKGSGDPVTALQKQDFKIFEDGKPQEIDFFEERGSGAAAAPAAAQATNTPAGLYTNIPPAPEGAAVNVLLVDLLNTQFQDQVYAQEQIRQLVSKMRPGTRAAVFVLGAQLRMVQGFTADPSVLLAALNDKKNGIHAQKDYSSYAPEDDLVKIYETMQRMGGGNPSKPGAPDPALDRVKKAAAKGRTSQANSRIRLTLDGLDELGRYLAGVPGRKNLIWFAGTFPVSVFSYVYQQENKEYQDSSDSQLTENRFRRTADLLTANRIALYPISSEGMAVSHLIDPESKVRPQAQVLDRRQPASTSYLQEGSQQAQTVTVMEELARDTGGKAFYNANDIGAAVLHAMENGSHYYTLAYTPTDKKMDGRFRRIEVKLANGGKYQLAYRHNYYADDLLPPTQNNHLDPLLPLLVHGLPSATQVLYSLQLNQADPQPTANDAPAGKNAKLTGPVVRYNAEFKIPRSEVDLENGPEDTHVGKIQLALAAYDREGNALNWNGYSALLKLTPETYAKLKGVSLPARVDIDLPANTAYLATGVYDWTTGKAGTLEIPVQVAGTESHPNAGAAHGTP